jgi:hypothetical protein
MEKTLLLFRISSESRRQEPDWKGTVKARVGVFVDNRIFGTQAPRDPITGEGPADHILPRELDMRSAKSKELVWG